MAEHAPTPDPSTPKVQVTQIAGLGAEKLQFGLPEQGGAGGAHEHERADADADATKHPMLEGALTRWLGVGLASLIAILTIWLAAASKLTLYIAPEAVWYAVPAAIVLLIVAIASLALPIGTEDHAHDHGHAHGQAHGQERGWGVVALAGGAVVASAFVVLAFFLPPKTLSVELAMSRNPATTVLFAGADDRVLGAATDTSNFGIGEWSTVFRTTTQPENFDGKPVQLTGFLTPGATGDQAALTRMVVTHCVIDAQPVALPIAAPGWEAEYGVGQWVSIDGVIRASADGTLEVEPLAVTPIDEPGDPYEF